MHCPETGKLQFQQLGEAMVALLITLYVIGFLGFGAFILFAALLGAMFGTLPGGTYVKLVIAAALWPLMVLWGLANVVRLKIRN